MSRLRVAVAMSGGVDSAVSALLLKRRGFDVFGVYMINWDRAEEGTSTCPRTKDEADARYACEKLHIPFISVNFVKEYWNDVFVNMLENYRHGRTVVPDIACNRHIKFERFRNYAVEKHGAQFIATGHYVSTSLGDFQENRLRPAENVPDIRLLCGLDPLKDQSYFLCTLKQEQLNVAMFPVGSMTKTNVRRIAKEQGLDEIATKPESMGICFVGKRKNFNGFIDQYIEPCPGEIRTLSGKLLGRHEGVHHFTLGKRIPIQGCHLGYFVANIDSENRIVYACKGSHHPSLYATEFSISEPQWICKNPLADREHVTVECRIQRTHPPIACSLKRLGESVLLVKPVLPLRAVANGQMCVFYNGRECLGGGEVQKITSTLDY
ncbi:unnamed protein product [Nippostrongylus brasiliensis]|uniref:tRNA-5-taurinomethyluridine 2-sulfurtransferase n=1 Tax=Nippostrongylus brasiliensis TaxID=27835 RepID=A0A0N4YVW8_NIPBR|nr:unnamed protein product [Nippostrongylus brasiliensis]